MISDLPKPPPSNTSNFEFRISNFRRSAVQAGFILKAFIILALMAAVFGGGAWFTYTLFIQPEQNLKNESAFGTPSPPPTPPSPSTSASCN